MKHFNPITLIIECETKVFRGAYVALINVYSFILHHVFSSSLHTDKDVNQILSRLKYCPAANTNQIPF